MTLSQEDKDVYEMYVYFLVHALCDVTKVSFPNLRIYFNNVIRPADDCEGYFIPEPYIRDTSIEIGIPVDSTLSALREDIEITIIHEFAHYVYYVKLRTSKRRQLNDAKYFDNENFKWKEEQRTWIQTRELAKKLGLWNCKTMRRCLAADKSAVVVKEYEKERV